MKSKTEEAMELVNGGMKVREAAEKIGISTVTIYAAKKKQNETKSSSSKKTEPLTKRRYRKRPQVIALQTTPNLPMRGEQVFAFYGTANEVANLVRSLQ